MSPQASALHRCLHGGFEIDLGGAFENHRRSAEELDLCESRADREASRRQRVSDFDSILSVPPVDVDQLGDQGDAQGSRFFCWLGDGTTGQCQRGGRFPRQFQPRQAAGQ